MTEKIVILGAGYGGITTGHILEKASQEFLLINRNTYHYFTTQLHEVAGGRAGSTNHFVSLSDVFHSGTSHILIDEVSSIDRENRIVHLKSGDSQPYDWLVVTLGSIPEYFGIPGLAEYSFALNDLYAAKKIRDHITEQVETYVRDGDPRHLRIVVGGGGLTGIELLGELLDLLPQLCVNYDIDPEFIDLQGIEASPQILPQMSRGLRQTALEILTDKGAKLHLNRKITKVTDKGIQLDDGTLIDAGTFIWTGGVRANPILEQAGFAVKGRGRAKVNPFLQAVDDPHVFIGGDSAWYEDKEGRPVPPTAQMALQMGHAIAYNLQAAIANRPMKRFNPHSMGTLASIGPGTGLGNVLGIPVRGALGSVLKESTKLKYLWDLGGLKLLDEKAR